MLIGFNGSTNNGYNVIKLIQQIDKKLKFKEVQKAYETIQKERGI